MERLVYCYNLSVARIASDPPLARLRPITPIMRFHYVYVLLSGRDYKFYIGSTNDLRRRITEHKRGKNISTAKRLPIQLVFYETYPTKSDAERRERYFKTAKGKTMLRSMLKDYLRQDF